MNFRENASYYVHLFSIPVFPCLPRGKVPLTPHGLKDSTRDDAIVRAWGERWSDANVGLVTGKASGILVLDVDSKNQGYESLSALEAEHGALPVTPTVDTGGGGKHFYFARPNYQRIGNRAGIRPGLDIRCDGGYVVAPDSEHESGKRYQWAPGLTLAEVQLAPVPPWLLGIIVGPAPRAPGAEMLGQDDLWISLAANGAQPGTRNDTLARFTGHLLGCRVDARVVLELMLAWNRVLNRPPLPDSEVKQTVNSIAKAEARRRREVLRA